MGTQALTYAQRNAASELAAVAQLGPNDLIYTPGPPQFSDLAASILGNAGTPADGWDALFSSVASIVDGDIAGLSVFDSILSDIGFTVGALDAVMFSPIAHSYSAYLQAGDAILGETDTQVNPPPTQKPPKVTIQPPPRSAPNCKNRFPYAHYTFDGATLDDPCVP